MNTAVRLLPNVTPTLGNSSSSTTIQITKSSVFNEPNKQSE
jgi:hypothetical protein